MNQLPIQFCRGHFLSLLHKKFKGVVGLRNEKQPLNGILSTACSFIQYVYRNMSRLHAHFINLYGRCENFHSFPRKVSYYKRPPPKPVTHQLWRTALCSPL